ncbi:MAG: AraC family transcriptional regulator [Lachnospiraceae bacterium]|nr:AraC family transcriptional regulator [Lachnospiraceae bacterium]
MQPLYEEKEAEFEVYVKRSEHVSPHLHKSMEFVYVTGGTLEIGVGQELYHMEKGDFAIVFPEMIHHYQVFGGDECEAIYILVAPSLCERFADLTRQKCPEDPVIPARKVHTEIPYAMGHLAVIYREQKAPEESDLPPESIGILSSDPLREALISAYIQIILARSIPCCHLIEKQTVDSTDLIYRTVSYISAHFTETVTLTKMARDLYVSPYTLSRVFSATFHTNFNGYLNDARLEYVCSLLRYTDQSITEACENAGFESQRTFNRVFREKFHMSPRAWKNALQEFTEI